MDSLSIAADAKRGASLRYFFRTDQMRDADWLVSYTPTRTKMKNLTANLGVNIVALICIGSAAYLAINEKTGWGWFLFVGLLCAGSVTVRDKTTDTDDD